MDLGITILANFHPLIPFPASESILERYMCQWLMPRSYPKANPYQNILTETWKTQKPPADPRVGWLVKAFDIDVIRNALFAAIYIIIII